MAALQLHCCLPNSAPCTKCPGQDSHCQPKHLTELGHAFVGVLTDTLAQAAAKQVWSFESDVMPAVTLSINVWHLNAMIGYVQCTTNQMIAGLDLNTSF